MNIVIRKYKEEDIPQMVKIWNEVVEDANAFPQEEPLTESSAKAFFGGQTYSAVAEDIESGVIYGLYILHPNNIGRCGHICNASYAVGKTARGLHIGEKLVSDSLAKGAERGFRILQFNAVVASNTAARRLYDKLGFTQLGTIPGGFRTNDGSYADICPYYHKL